MNKDLSISEQTTKIADDLKATLKLGENDIISVTPVTDSIYTSIKALHNDSAKMHVYAFFDITIIEQAKSRLTSSSEYFTWKTIDELKSKPRAMSNNSDVIELLERLPAPQESFINPLGNISIIWNITSKCSYNCAICATHDESRIELSTSDKLKVLNNITTAKNMITNVDFAGGDPLQLEDGTTIIQSAIAHLGADRVSVTTTGSGIEHSNENFPESIKRCEITIDAAHSNQQDSPLSAFSISREEQTYSDSNMRQIDLISEHIDMLTINIPILNDDLNDSEIDTLISKIEYIKTHTTVKKITASLIRLMPVGKMTRAVSKDEYMAYNPISIAQKIKTRLGDIGIDCKLHCSLRVLPAFDNDSLCEYCSMLERKLGIDCAGNVFACAWGGYADNNGLSITKNPFYLGNLVSTSLKKILEGEMMSPAYRHIFSEIENKKQRKFCSVVSHYVGGEPFENHDPLAIPTTPSQQS